MDWMTRSVPLEPALFGKGLEQANFKERTVSLYWSTKQEYGDMTVEVAFIPEWSPNYYLRATKLIGGKLWEYAKLRPSRSVQTLEQFIKEAEEAFERT